LLLFEAPQFLGRIRRVFLELSAHQFWSCLRQSIRTKGLSCFVSAFRSDLLKALECFISYGSHFLASELFCSEFEAIFHMYREGFLVKMQTIQRFSTGNFAKNSFTQYKNFKNRNRLSKVEMPSETFK
jgi:hypothetical protein